MMKVSHNSENIYLLTFYTICVPSAFGSLEIVLTEVWIKGLKKKKRAEAGGLGSKARILSPVRGL